MKYVLINCHPYEQSFNAAIVKEITTTAVQNKIEIDIIDLCDVGFNPVLSKSELYEFSQARTKRGVIKENLDPMALNFAERINRCDHVIMVFPIWWELMPAQVKGFIDKVIFPEIFYTYKTEYSMKLVSTTLRQVTIITTMNTPHILYSLKFGNCIKSALVDGTFKKLGVKKVNWINFSGIKLVGNKGREKYLKKISKIVT